MSDPLEPLRERIDALDEVELERRPEVFEEVAATLTAELDALEESQA